VTASAVSKQPILTSLALVSAIATTVASHVTCQLTTTVIHDATEDAAAALTTTVTHVHLTLTVLHMDAAYVTPTGQEKTALCTMTTKSVTPSAMSTDAPALEQTTAMNAWLTPLRITTGAASAGRAGLVTTVATGTEPAMTSVYTAATAPPNTTVLTASTTPTGWMESGACVTRVTEATDALSS